MGSCDVSGRQVGIAFACVIGAGLATIIGALLVLFTPLRNGRVLGGALSLAVGVMVYVAFVDIYAGKAVGHFVDAGYSDALAFTYATLSFFAGVPVTIALDYAAGYIMDHSSRQQRLGLKWWQWRRRSGVARQDTGEDDVELAAAAASARGDVLPALASATEHPTDDGKHALTAVALEQADADCAAIKSRGLDAASDVTGTAASTGLLLDQQEQRALAHIGLLAGLAIALHNIPEGLVTFVGYIDSPSTGVTIAIAIALHNIPEGMVVAAPVAYATGSRAKAIFWAAMSGLTEPIGGAIGLAIVCGAHMSDEVFGVLFGIVGGIMVYICFSSLYPKACKFDPEGRLRAVCIVLGMAIMAASIIAIGFFAT